MKNDGYVLDRAYVHLHGRLGRKFGKGPYFWGVQTAAEAIRALDRMKPGFRVELAKGDYLLVRGPRHGGLELGLDLLDFRLGVEGHLHIVPAARGAGGGRGTGKVVAGVALVALAAASGGLAGAGVAGFATTAGGAATIGGVSASSIGMFGASLIFSGAASMLSPQPKTPRPQERTGEVARNPSFLFDGPGMVMEQGRIVPVVYGHKVRTGGVLIASSYAAEDVNPAGAAAATPPPPVDGDGTYPSIAGDRRIRFDPVKQVYVYTDTGEPSA